MLIKIFPTPFDNFHFYGSAGLVPKLILTPCLIRFFMHGCNFLKVCHIDPFGMSCGSWEVWFRSRSLSRLGMPSLPTMSPVGLLPVAPNQIKIKGTHE